MSESYEDLENMSADDLPIVRVLRLADADPRKALQLLNRLTDDRDNEWWVLARFRAYQMLASAPFIRAHVPPDSGPQELLRVAEDDTVHLCEMAIAELSKIEHASIELTLLTTAQFTEASSDGSVTDRQRADAICTILERLRPRRVQELRGMTMLKYLGRSRVGGLHLRDTLGAAETERIANVLFGAPWPIGCLIASGVSTAHGGWVVAFRAFSEVTLARPESDPGRCVGVLRFTADGVLVEAEGSPTAAHSRPPSSPSSAPPGARPSAAAASSPTGGNMRYTKQQRRDAYHSLPPHVQDFVHSNATTELIERLLLDAGLSTADEQNAGDSAILYAMYGLHSLQDAIAEIARLVNKAPEDFGELEFALEEQIFSRLRQANHATTAAPSAGWQPVPAPPVDRHDAPNRQSTPPKYSKIVLLIPVLAVVGWISLQMARGPTSGSNGLSAGPAGIPPKTIAAPLSSSQTETPTTSGDVAPLTALGQAAYGGELALVQRLIRDGADANQGFGYKGSSTPLIAAASKGHLSVVQALVAAGAQLDRDEESSGMTALGTAAREGYEEIVRYLVTAGARLTGGGVYDPIPPLHAAAAAGQDGIVRILLEGGADPAEVQNGHTALELARAANHLTVVSTLSAALTAKAELTVDSAVAGTQDTVAHDLTAVDEPVAVGSCPSPTFPAEMRAAGIQGSVTVRFVVGVTGMAEPPSISVVSSTNKAFEAPARDAILHCTFRPAKIKGVSVRQLVEQMVRFVTGR